MTAEKHRNHSGLSQPGVLSRQVIGPSAFEPRPCKTHLWESLVLPHSTNDKKWLRDMKGLVQGHTEFNSSALLLDCISGLLEERKEMMSVYMECGIISIPQGGLPGGGGNGTHTAVLDSTLADADTASQAPKMPLGKPTHGPSSSPLVTTKIDQVAGINYSLVAPLTATADSLDGQLKVRLTPRDVHLQAFVLDPPGVPHHPYLRTFSLLQSHWPPHYS